MDFFSAVRRYFGVLGALLRQEEERRRHSPMESIINLLEPIILIGTLTFLFYLLGRRPVSPLGGAPIMFYATGFFPLYFFIYISRRMRGSIDAPRRRFPIEQRLDHIIVHVILRIIDYSILGILVFGGIYLAVTSEAIPKDLPKVLMAGCALVGLGFGWGMLNLILSKTLWVWKFAFPSISRSVVLFSGVMYVPDFLSPGTRELFSYNPLMHAVQLFRLGFYPYYPALLLDVNYLMYCALFSLFFGLVLERVTRRLEAAK